MAAEDFLNNTSLIILGIFILTLLGVYSIYKPFLLSLSVAILLAMATYNIVNQLSQKLNSRLAGTIISTMMLILILFVPMIYIATSGVEYISQLDNTAITQTVDMAQKLLQKIPLINEYAIDKINDDQIAKFVEQSSAYLATAGKAGIGFAKNMFLVLLFYFFINYYGVAMFNFIKPLIPISEERFQKMSHEVSSTMEVVLYSTIVTAIFEGFLFGIIVSYFGFNGLLFGIIYGLASLIPVVGGAIVWIPVSLYAWSTLDSVSAIIIALYSIIIISIIADTFIKPIIIKFIKEEMLHSTVEINALVIFFSIVAGMSTYGFWGIIIGPAITSFLIAIIKIGVDYKAMSDT